MATAENNTHASQHEYQMAFIDICGDFHSVTSLEGKDLVEGRVQKYGVEMSAREEVKKHLWLTQRLGLRPGLPGKTLEGCNQTELLL